jgi:hypothetical protein
MSGCITFGKQEVKDVSKVSNNVFNIASKNKFSNDLRYVVKEEKGWEKDLNKQVHPHIIPVRTESEGGPGWISHRWVEFTKLNPGTVLWDCRNEENNFVYCNVALKYIGDYGRNAVEVAALRSIIQGHTREGDYPVIRAYFYLSSMLEETKLDIMPAEFPYLSNSERSKTEEKKYIKSLDKSPSSEGKPVIQGFSPKAKKTENDDQMSF